MRAGLSFAAAAAALLLSGFTAGNSAGAAELDINFSDKAARLTGMWHATGRLQADAGWLHNTDRGNVAHAGVHLVDFATGGTHPIEAGLGGRVAWFESDIRDRSGWAIPLGGFFRLNVPDADRIQIGGSAYYAPTVLSFDGGDGYFEASLFAGYEVLRQGLVYVGYRYANAEFTRARSATIDTGLHLGLRLQF